MGVNDQKIRSLKIKSLGGIHPAADSVQRVTQETGVELPSEYLQVVLEYGCWYTPLGYTRFRFKHPVQGREDGILNVFFGIMPGHSYDVAKNFKTYRGRVRSGLLPIANDPGGNIICLSTRGGDRGSVYLWDHEQETPGRVPSDANLYLIADSFEDFINRLEFEQLEDE